MRLTEFEPRWFTVAHPADGVDLRIGLTFLCPHCRAIRLGIQFHPPIDPAGLIEKLQISWPKAEKVWLRSGDTFETLTITPSIDVSMSATLEFDGHWHGHITNGEIV